MRRKSLAEWTRSVPALAAVAEGEETLWQNAQRPSCADALAKAPISAADVADASARLSRFASFFRTAFPETRVTDGLLESPLKAIPRMKDELAARYGCHMDGRLFVKLDSHLAVSGSIKARGGIYEVLCFAEQVAMREGGLTVEDDYAVLDTPKYKDIFSRYSIAVGSTGNLGLSIGIISARLGFRVSVHMSADAREWKKAMLRARGVNVIEYQSDYSVAVENGRKEASRDPFCHFVDDENSKTLFLGYAVAAERLAVQLADAGVTVDEGHPLHVYLPCGVGGGPGGVAFGLKLIYGDYVHIYFAEPTEAPCMLVGMATGLHNAVCVGDFGRSGRTRADGLAVGRASGFVGALMLPLVDGCYTVKDERMSALLSLLRASEGVSLEPSALAGMYGPVMLARSLGEVPSGTHLAWATGGSMVPPEILDTYDKEGREALTLGF